MPFFEKMFRKTNAKFDIMAPIKPEKWNSRNQIQGSENKAQNNKNWSPTI